MQFEITGDAGTEWTDSPRDLTDDEVGQIIAAGRLKGVVLHRRFTNSTLSAAIRIVDAVIRNHSASRGSESASAYDMVDVTPMFSQTRVFARGKIS